MPRWVRIALITICSLVTLLVAVIGALQVPVFSTWTVNQLTGLAPLAPGWRLHVARAEGNWLTRLRLADVTLRHDSALVARIGSIEARYGPFTLAIGLPVVDAILVDDVEVTATRGPDGWDLATALERDSTPAEEDSGGGFGIDTLSLTNVRARALLAPDSSYALSGFILQAHGIRTGRVTTATLDTIGGTAEPPAGGPLRFSARGVLAPESLELPLLLVTGPRTRVTGRADVPLAWDEPAGMNRLQAELRADPLDLSEVAAWTPAVAPGHDLYLDLQAAGSDGKVAVRFDGRLGEGAITAEARIAPPRDGALDLEVDGRVSRFDPSLLATAAPPSVVDGTFDVALAGPSADRIGGHANADLTALRVGTTDVDFIRLRAPFTDGRTAFTFETELLDGRAEASGSMRPFDERPAFEVAGNASGFPQLVSLHQPLGVPAGDALVVAFTAAGDGGSLEALRARGRVDLASADSSGRREVLGGVPFEVADGALRAQPDIPLLGGRASGLVQVDLMATPLGARARLSLVGMDQGAQVDSVALEARYSDGRASFAVDARLPAEGRVVIEGDADLSGEAPSLEITRGEFSTLDLGAILPRDSLQTDLNGTFGGSGSGIDIASARARFQLTLRPSTINQASVEQGDGRLELADGAFELTLEASGPNGMVDLAASGTILEPERTVHAEGRLGVRDLDRWAGRPMLAGHLDGVFRFDGVLDSAGIRRADGVLSARGQVGEVEVDSVHAAIRSNGRTSVSVDTLFVRSNTMSAAGGGVIALRPGPDTTAFLLTGQVLDGDPIARTLDRIDFVLDTARFEVRAAGPATATRVTGAASIVNLIYGTSQVSQLAGGGDAVINVDARKLRAAAGSLSVPGAVLGGIAAREVAVQVRYDSVVSGSASAILGHELEFTARMTGRPARDSLVGLIEELSLENSIRRWALDRPAPVVLQPTIVVDSLILRSEGDRWISVDGTMDPEGENAMTVAFDGLAFDMFRGSALDWLQGSLSGAVTYAGTAEFPAAEGQLTWGVVGRGGEGAGEIASRFAWSQAGVLLDARVAHADSSELTARGWIPAAMWTANAPGNAPGDTVSLRIHSDGLNLQLLEALTPPETIKEFNGQLVLDATMAGAVASPTVDGTVRLVDASGTFPPVGVTYDSMAFEASLAGSDFRLTELGLVTGEGRLSASGEANLSPLSNPSFDFQTTMDRFRLARNAILRSQVDSGGLRLSGTLDEPVLEGRLVMGRTDAYVDGGGAATDAEAVELTREDLEKLARDFGPSVLVNPDDGTMLERFRMDLTVYMPGGVWVRRRKEPKVDIEVRGEIQVTQEPGGEMQFLGTVQPVPGRGYLQLYGKEFRLASGEIKLVGPVADTRLEVVAEYEVSNKGGLESEPITITVETSGTLDTLDVQFSSNPTMGQDDIVSYLITGRPASDNVIASSSGGNVGADLAINELAEGLSSSAGQAVGLDVFQIKPDGLRGLTMVAGQYVLPDLFLSLEQPVQIKSDTDDRYPPGPSFEVEYGVNEWLRTTVRAGSKPFALFLKGRRAY